MVSEVQPEAQPVVEEPRTGIPSDAPLTQPPSDTPAEEPVFESGEKYVESLSQSLTDGAKAPDSTKPAPRSPLADPRAAEYDQRYRQNTGNRHTRLDAKYKDFVDAGVSEPMARSLVNELKSLLNEQGADGLNLAGFTAAQLTRESEWADVRAGLVASLPSHVKELSAEFEAIGKANDGFVPYADMFGATVALARKGYVTDKDHKAAIAKAFNDGENQGKRLGASQDSGNGQRVSGRSGAQSASGSSWKTKAEARALHVQGKLSSQEMKRIEADPSIPQGM